MAKTKLFYAEAVISELVSQFKGRDLKIDPREVIVRMDAMVNARAKQDFIDKFKGNLNVSPDEQYLTRLEYLVPTDPANGAPSYVTLTTSYVALPGGQGIEEVYFENAFSTNKKKYFDPVIIERKKDRALYRSNMAAGLEGRISCYPKGITIVFDRGNIGSTYGNVGVSLVVRNFETLSDDAIYPIGADFEQQMITDLVEWFRNRLLQPEDLIKDAVSNK